MKLLFSISLLIAIFVLTVEGQTLSATNQAVGTNGTFTIKERGAHHRVWERVVNETNLSGQVVQQVRRYTELASGLHYWDTNANSWKDSNERIQPVPGGAAAVQGQHQVYFPYDLYAGVIEMVTPEGQHLKSRPLCLNYFDGTNSVVFATLQSTVGQIVGSNQVVYANAFTNDATGQILKADVVYTYRKGSFEQDIVLRQQPPAAESFGLNSDNIQLEVLTEFFELPQPALAVRSVQTAAGQFEDDEISFGQMRMGYGKAFTLGTNGPTAAVNKRWLQVDGRQILSEEAPLSLIQDELSKLPIASAATDRLKEFERMASGKRTLPGKRFKTVQEKRRIEMAKAKTPDSGFVLDYITLNGAIGTYLFQSDTTYYITGPTYPSLGTTFEWGTVIKFSASGSIR